MMGLKLFTCLTQYLMPRYATIVTYLRIETDFLSHEYPQCQHNYLLLRVWYLCLDLSEERYYHHVLQGGFLYSRDKREFLCLLWPLR